MPLLSGQVGVLVETATPVIAEGGPFPAGEAALFPVVLLVEILFDVALLVLPVVDALLVLLVVDALTVDVLDELEVDVVVEVKGHEILLVEVEV